MLFEIHHNSLRIFKDGNHWCIVIMEHFTNIQESQAIFIREDTEDGELIRDWFIELGKEDADA